MQRAATILLGVYGPDHPHVAIIGKAASVGWGEMLRPSSPSNAHGFQ